MDFFVVYTVLRNGKEVRQSTIIFALTAEEARRAFELQEQPFIFGFVEVEEVCEVVEGDFNP